MTPSRRGVQSCGERRREGEGEESRDEHCSVGGFVSR